MSTHEKHLYSLDELSDYKVADGYPDVRGWSVKDADNRIIGKVDNLLVSKEAERVVYVDVDVDQTIIDAKYDPYSNPENPEVREFINKEGENHIIIPIGMVDFNESLKHVVTHTVNHRTFAETKRYKKGTTLDRDYEEHVLSSYDRPIKRTDDDTHVDIETSPRTTTNLSESRIREIIREEIRDYHNSSPTDSFDDIVSDRERFDEQYRSTRKTAQYDLDGDGDVDVEVSKNYPSDMDRKRTNDDYDDNFYDRREFDRKRHGWD